MRKLTKGKGRKSESLSDAESEANGDSVHTNEDADQMMPNNDGESAPKSKRRASRGRDKSMTDDSEGTKNDMDDVKSLESSKQENGNTSKSGEKRRKRESRQATTSQDEKSDQEYEVEKLIADRTIKGRRQFLVRWKGYSTDDDSWEFEKDLNCSKLIEDFLNEKLNDEKTDEKTKKTADRSKVKRGRKPKTKKRINNEKDTSENDGERAMKKPRKSREVKKDTVVNKDEDEDEDGGREFEVEKIIDVHFKKNKNREFLIRWKGFSPANDTWEPEENLNCQELIAKFMDKVDKAKVSGVRELRTNPSHTKRYTLTMHNKERRLSRRNLGKQRATYHQCDE